MTPPSTEKPQAVALLPCPFCDGEYARLEGRCIACVTCGASSTDRPTIEGAIKAWNRRASQERNGPVAWEVVGKWSWRYREDDGKAHFHREVYRAKDSADEFVALCNRKGAYSVTITPLYTAPLPSPELVKELRLRIETYAQAAREMRDMLARGIQSERALESALVHEQVVEQLTAILEKYQ